MKRRARPPDPPKMSEANFHFSEQSGECVIQLDDTRFTKGALRIHALALEVLTRQQQQQQRQQQQSSAAAAAPSPSPSRAMATAADVGAPVLDAVAGCDGSLSVEAAAGHAGGRPSATHKQHTDPNRQKIGREEFMSA